MDSFPEIIALNNVIQIEELWMNKDGGNLSAYDASVALTSHMVYAPSEILGN